MTAAVVVGSTGLVGSQILTTLLTHPTISTIHAPTRRPLPSTPGGPTSSKLHPLILPDSSTWASTLSTLAPPPSLFLSALGTTRANAGSLPAQRAIDHDLNLSLARAAKTAGVRVYVLISTAGASTASAFAYPRMKAEVEEGVKGMGFGYTVILRPGLLVGERGERRVAEGVLRGVASGAGWVSSGWLKDWWAQDADVVGRAAVRAGVMCLEGKAPVGEGGVWVVGQGEIVRLGRESGGFAKA